MTFLLPMVLNELSEVNNIHNIVLLNIHQKPAISLPVTIILSPFKTVIIHFVFRDRE